MVAVAITCTTDVSVSVTVLPFASAVAVIVELTSVGALPLTVSVAVVQLYISPAPSTCGSAHVPEPLRLPIRASLSPFTVTERSVKVLCTRTLWATVPDGAKTHGRVGALRTSIPGAGVGQKAFRPWLTTPKASPSLPANSPAGSSSRASTPRKPPALGTQLIPSPVSGSTAAIWKRGSVLVSVSRYRKCPLM